MVFKDKRRRSFLAADIPLGKLLIGLRYLAETAPVKNKRPPTTNKNHVVFADLSRYGVERKSPLEQNGKSRQLVPWNRLEMQLSKSPSSLPLLFTNEALKGQEVKMMSAERCLVVKFVIGKILYTIGMEGALLESPTFFCDVYNLVSYRRAVMFVRTRLADTKLEPFWLGGLPSADHGWQLVPMHPDLVELSEFVHCLCVIVLKVNSAGSSSSDETPRSTEDSTNEDLAMWKVWNWSMIGDYGYDMDPDHMYNGEPPYITPSGLWGDGLGSGGSLFDFDEPPEIDDVFTPHEYVYSKDMMLSLKDSPLSRKKPESVDRIAAIARNTYNGFMRRSHPPHAPPRLHSTVRKVPLDSDDCYCNGEVREYSRKFLLSLRYAPLSLRRPSVCSVNTYRHQPSVSPYKQHF